MLGTAKDVTGLVAGLLGSTVVEVRDANNAVAFTVGRTGFPMKKDQVKGPNGEVVGRYKAKMMSVSGGYHVYDKDGKHVAEIQGKMMKAAYKFVTPDRTEEMGTVSRTMGGLAKSLFTGSDTYAVQISPKFAGDATAKMLILGATIAVESFLKKKGSKAAEGGGEGDEE